MTESTDTGTAGAPAPGLEGVAPAEPLTGTRLAAHDALAELARQSHDADGATARTARARYMEASEHVFGNGPAPSWLAELRAGTPASGSGGRTSFWTPPSARTTSNGPSDGGTAEQDDTSPWTDEHGFSGEAREQIAEIYRPAESPEDYALPVGASLPSEWTGEHVGELRGMLHSLALPAETGSEVLGRYAHHLAMSTGDRLASADALPAALPRLSEEDAQQYGETMIQMMGGPEKAQETVRKAMNYMERTMPAEARERLFALVDGTSFAFDVPTLRHLAALHDAHGLKLPEG